MSRHWVWATFLSLPLLPSCQPREPSFPNPPNEILSSPEAARAGKGAFLKHCAICHGALGHGDGPQSATLEPRPADLRNLRGVRSEAGYWFFRIKEGGKTEPLARPRSAMPSWGEHLTDEEIWEVVAYLKSLTGERA